MNNQIGVAKEVTQGMRLPNESPVTEVKPDMLLHESAIKADHKIVCNARFDCPSCGRGIAVHIETKIK